MLFPAYSTRHWDAGMELRSIVYLYTCTPQTRQLCLQKQTVPSIFRSLKKHKNVLMQKFAYIKIVYARGYLHSSSPDSYHQGRQGFSSTLGTSGTASFFTTNANGFCSGGLNGLRGGCWSTTS